MPYTLDSYTFRGLSTDTKPTTDPAGRGLLPTGSRFIEIDTGTIYDWNGSAWIAALYDTGSGGGGVGGAVDTELPAAVALADNAANPTAPAVGSFALAWNATSGVWHRAADGTGKADSASFGITGASLFGFNGSTWDRWRNNSNAVVLASAARTSTVGSDQINYNGKGVSVVLNVTSAGTGSITLSIQVQDPISSNYVTVLTGLAVTTISTNRYRVYPGMAALANVSADDIIDRNWRVLVTHNNSNSMTYSVNACTML